MEVPKVSKRCSVSGRELAPGEAYFSALVETPTGLERRDFAAEYWTAPPEGSVGHWKGTLPRADEVRKPVVTTERLRSAFDEQQAKSESGDQQASRLAFVLALWLIRRKAFKIERVDRNGDREYLALKPLKETTIIRTLDPRLSEDRIRDVEDQLNELLGSTPEPETDQR